MEIAKKVLRVCGWLCAATVALVVCVYLMLLGINVRDQPPSDAAIRFQQSALTRAPIADEENAYVYMMGFLAPKHEDPRTLGKTRIAWAQQLFSRPVVEQDLDFPGEDYDLQPEQPEEITQLLNACKTVDQTCLRALEAGDQNLAKWLEQRHWLLVRYHTLLAHPGWHETIPFDVRLPLPPYAGVFDAQKLLFVQAWIAAGNADAASVQTLLEADVRFWRQALASSDILISKMLALAALRNHFYWSNIVLRRLPADGVAQGMPPSWLVSISDLERSLLRCLEGEWVFFNSAVGAAKESFTDESAITLGLENSSRLAWYLFRPMIQLQDTSNRQAERFFSIHETLQVPLDQFPQAVEYARKAQIEAGEAGFPHRAYNIGGDILFLLGSWDMTGYAARVADIEGLRRVAVLSAGFHRRAIPLDEIPRQLLKADIRDPYTGKPFVWDAKLGAIVFAGLEPGVRGRHAVLY